MSKIYDNWEKLVKATFLREEFRRLSREDSIPTSVSSELTLSFRELDPTPIHLGIQFSYQQIAEATNIFSRGSLIKRGHSGDFFTGYFSDFSTTLVVKRILFNHAVNQEANFYSEMEFFSRINSYSRFVPLVGHCFHGEKEKFLVYGYLENRDLSNSLFYKSGHRRTDSLPSLDWITRLKIAIGVAQGLTFLHHECNPPLAHGDVQASSVLLDHNFEVRLGSLTQVSAQDNHPDSHQAKKVSFPWDVQAISVLLDHNFEVRLGNLTQLSAQDNHPDSHQAKKVSFPWKRPKKDKAFSIAEKAGGCPQETCADNVFCFGKVLLELVTGNLGISSSKDNILKGWLETTLAYISLYDMELVANIMDKSLIIDEDLLEEVWAMAVVAKACLNPKPSTRPLMRDILRALENPLNVVRGQRNISGPLITARRHNPSDIAAVLSES